MNLLKHNFHSKKIKLDPLFCFYIMLTKYKSIELKLIIKKNFMTRNIFLQFFFMPHVKFLKQLKYKFFYLSLVFPDLGYLIKLFYNKEMSSLR